ncbi:MAG TPA: hypothetical protein VHR16_05765 [Candidatus Limnocylindrales bacterium]|jgi:hypothetical protein|nr:hypothetical protein [Candidatus Limnocylindrales bacterium]
MDNNQRRNRGQWGRNDDSAPRKPEPRRDAGAYIGRMPERATETIPGGLGRKDERVSAVATQPAPVRGDTRADAGVTPEGHVEAGNATDDAKREAGQNR